MLFSESIIQKILSSNSIDDFIQNSAQIEKDIKLLCALFAPFERTRFSPETVFGSIHNCIIKIFAQKDSNKLKGLILEFFKTNRISFSDEKASEVGQKINFLFIE